MYIKQPVCNFQISNILSRFNFLNKGADGVLGCDFVITRMALFCKFNNLFKRNLAQLPHTILQYDRCGKIKALYKLVKILNGTKLLNLLNIPIV